jgi:hypothetical protein
MSISRERAVDLSHRILEHLEKQPGVSLTTTRELVRAKILQVLNEWDRESGRLEDEVRAKLLARGKRVVEGTRDYDILFAEEMVRAFEALLGRGE